MNKLNLPEYIENMDVQHAPIPEHIGATDLVRPPIMRTLYLRHWKELAQDVSEKFNLFSGNAWDEYCKKHCRWALTNIRIEIPTLDKLKIICKPDYYHVLDYILADFKEKSVWNIVKFDPTNVFSKENVGQVNIYSWAVNKTTPLRIDKLQLHIRGKDWRAREKLQYGHQYPDIPFGVIDVPKWSFDEQEDYIDTQLKDHLHNPERECSDFEKMRKPDQYAVMKAARKSALRVLDSYEEAMKWCSENNYTDSKSGILVTKPNISIVKRPGSCVRCQQYCSVSEFCPYYKPESEE